MFEQSVIPSGSTNRLWAAAAALLVQILGVGVILILPMIYFQVLTPREVTSVFTVPVPPLPPPPAPPHSAVTSHVRRVIPRPFNPNGLIAPISIPKDVPIISEPAEALENRSIAGVPGGVPGGQMGGVLGGILQSLPNLPPPPPAAKSVAPKEPAPPQRIQLGGDVEAGRLIHKVDPRYPALARMGRIGGTVLLKAVIGRDGSVEDLSAISGHPLLIQAALDAVKQWVYKPTYLNGNAVEVSTDIVVHFRLAS